MTNLAPVKSEGDGPFGSHEILTAGPRNSTPRRQPEMLYTVQALRGLAVLLVVLYHGTIILFNRHGAIPFHGVFGQGFAGVYLFFVLSGFIILTIHRKDIGKPSRLGWYLQRRLIRIYPIYWLVFLIWGGWRLIWKNPDIAEFFSNALLFEGRQELIVKVSWTMRYELIFYAVFALLIVNKRIGILALSLWFLTVLVTRGEAGPDLLNPFNLLFLFGLLSSVLYSRLLAIQAPTTEVIAIASLCLGIVLFAGTAIYYSSLDVHPLAWPKHTVPIVGFGLASASLVLASAGTSVDRFFQGRKLLGLVGNASYSIYLVHIQFEIIVFDAIKAADRSLRGADHAPLSADLLLCLIAFGAVVCGIIIHLLIEKPLLKLLRSRTSTRRAADTSAPLDPQCR